MTSTVSLLHNNKLAAKQCPKIHNRAMTNLRGRAVAKK